ncbi:type I phosphodiesterase/nucleotide pyrophosphatase [Chitinophaga niastensis]|uniref:Type I phosphodiesterase/nucleotide pyrophosphatase n=1 Tax=Chitinophaga niastensis TaxID=536980 RepID=A0A2P8HDT1_CHINA|nr:alkaline phosphatase family protein [Chitinophaga niastensis]PSL44378.1 type I phosphodiesterase/nucleotide pyrophosphatase [Chitinophaga niastensis]
MLHRYQQLLHHSLLFATTIAFTMACNKPVMQTVKAPEEYKITTAPQRKVLLIGIDGCKANALKAATAPNIQALLPHAVYSYDALTQPPTWSGPGWSSMLTGVWGNKHGVSDNSFSGSNFSQYPMIFKYIKATRPSLRTISIVSWPPINDKIVNNADVTITANDNDQAVKDSAVAHLASDNPDVMFVDFNGVDDAGHKFGFDTSVPQYLQAITKIDDYVGSIIQALGKRNNIDKEDWLIILSTDHGGNMAGHGGNSYEEQNIFTIYYNKNFETKEIKKPQTASTFVKFLQSGQRAWTGNPFYNFDNFTQFTVEFKVRSSGLSSDPPFITNKNWNSGRNKGWVICVAGQSWKFNAGDGSKRVDVSSGGAPLNDNNWHHIAVSVNRAGLVKLYQDGAFLKSGNMTGFSTLDPGSSIKLTMSEDITTTYGDDNGNAIFSIADIRLWNAEVDAQTIKDYSKCDTTITTDHPYYSNLIGWWKGNEGKGNVLKDASPKKADLQLDKNTPWEETGKDICGNAVSSDVPKIVDIPVRILTWLNIPVNPAWGLDGKLWQ